MIPRRIHTSSPSAPPAAQFRQVERQRRLSVRFLRNRPLPPEIYVRLTCSSFALEQLTITERNVTDAMIASAEQRLLRPRQVLRIRNHIAILRLIERAIRKNQPLKLADVTRWYTSISCGLSIGSIDASRAIRLEHCLRRINSPQLRLHPAITEAAVLHGEMLRDPIFPGFNGILVRLLLQYHLARCQLPPVAFDPVADARLIRSGESLAPRLTELISESYQLLLGRR